MAGTSKQGRAVNGLTGMLHVREDLVWVENQGSFAQLNSSRISYIKKLDKM